MFAMRLSSRSRWVGGEVHVGVFVITVFGFLAAFALTLVCEGGPGWSSV